MEGATGLNGMDIGDNGTIYAAGSDENKIVKVRPGGKVSVILESERNCT